MALETWMVTAAALSLMVLAYGWLALVMLKGIMLGHQWRTNPVAVATFAIFVTCTLGHGVHVFHVLTVPLGLDIAVGESARTAMADPVLLGWYGFTAAVAVWYLTLRSRLKIVHGGAALCDDMVKRQRNAALIHDQVIAGLGRARERLRAGDRQSSAAEVDAALAASRGIITELLGERGTINAFGPGDLRRTRRGVH